MMSLDARSHSLLLVVGAVLAPTVAVQAVRFLADSELAPAAASAAPVDPNALPPAAPAKVLTPKQQAAIKWLKDTATKVATRSPLEQPAKPKPANENPETVVNKEPELPPEPPDDRPKHLKVSGMVGTDTGALAAISGRLCRVGDEPAEGWIIERIDAHNRTVVLKHADGRSFEITPPTPELKR